MSTGKKDKGKPVLNLLAPTGANAAAFDKPGEGTLDDPTARWILGLTGDRAFNGLGFVASAAMLDMRCVELLFNHLMDIIIVVAFVGTEMLLNVLRVWALDHNGKDEVIGRPFVMLVGASDMNGEWCSELVNQNMDFCPKFASICGVLACFLPTQRCRTRLAINRLPFPANTLLLGIEQDHLFQNGFKDTLFTPGLELGMQHTAADAKPTPMDCLPLATRPHHIPDAVEDRPVVRRWSPSTSRIASLWYQMLHALPQLIGYLEIIYILRFCVSILAQDVLSLKDWFRSLLFNEIRLFVQPSLFFG